MGIIASTAVPVIGLSGVMKDRTSIEIQPSIPWSRILRHRHESGQHISKVKFSYSYSYYT